MTSSHDVVNNSKGRASSKRRVEGGQSSLEREACTILAFPAIRLCVNRLAITSCLVDLTLKSISDHSFCADKKTPFPSLCLMNRLPTEIQLKILSNVPATSYSALYKVFPQCLVDDALCIKLRRRSRRKPLLDLVSTNLHELLGPSSVNHKNESALGLHFEHFDRKHRLLWLLPDFASSQYLFVVKDAYVSHGKLVLRSHDQRHNSSPQKTIVSLWDIRKCFPPTRAGTFSGASEPAQHRNLWRFMTLDSVGCIIDACLKVHSAGNRAENTKDTKNINNEIPVHADQWDLKFPRPELPPNYARKIPPPLRVMDSARMASYSAPPCGYFLVERVAVGVSDFLSLEPRFS